MKINWGFGITVIIIVFIMISIGFIYFAFNQDINLVRDDYYEAELKLDEKIEIIKRTNQLSDKLQIDLFANNIKLVFPSLFKSNDIEGKIKLYRPSDRQLDFVLPVKLDSNNSLSISTNKLTFGMWKIQVDWSVDSLTFYNEKIIMIN